MNPRLRKAVAGLFVLGFLAFWIWGAVLIAAMIPDTSKPLRYLFFVVAGCGWGVPLFPIITWAEHGVLFRRSKT